MNVFQFAKQMEKEGEGYYRELAQKTGARGLKGILTMLAEAELSHYRAFENMEKRLPAQLPDTPILTDAKAIFAQMRGEHETVAAEQKQIVLYRKALEIEKKSRDFYEKHAGEAASPDQKAAFLKIADQEKQHYRIVEAMIDLVMQPERWLENAEWHHLDEY